MATGWTIANDASLFKKKHELQARNTTDGCNCAWYCGDKELALMAIGKVLMCHKCGGTIYMDETTFIDHAGYTRIMFDTKNDKNQPKSFLVMKLKYMNFYMDYLRSNLDKLEIQYEESKNS